MSPPTDAQRVGDRGDDHVAGVGGGLLDGGGVAPGGDHRPARQRVERADQQQRQVGGPGDGALRVAGLVAEHGGRLEADERRDGEHDRDAERAGDHLAGLQQRGGQALLAAGRSPPRRTPARSPPRRSAARPAPCCTARCCGSRASRPPPARSPTTATRAAPGRRSAAPARPARRRCSRTPPAAPRCRWPARGTPNPGRAPGPARAARRRRRRRRWARAGSSRRTRPRTAAGSRSRARTWSGTPAPLPAAMPSGTVPAMTVSGAAAATTMKTMEPTPRVPDEGVGGIRAVLAHGAPERLKRGRTTVARAPAGVKAASPPPRIRPRPILTTRESARIPASLLVPPRPAAPARPSRHFRLLGSRVARSLDVRGVRGRRRGAGGRMRERGRCGCGTARRCTGWTGAGWARSRCSRSPCPAPRRRRRWPPRR